MDAKHVESDLSEPEAASWAGSPAKKARLRAPSVTGIVVFPRRPAFLLMILFLVPQEKAGELAGLAAEWEGGFKLIPED